MKEEKKNICPKCGDEFVCGAENGNSVCWCNNLPPLKNANMDGSCYCKKCLIVLIEQQLSEGKGK